MSSNRLEAFSDGVIAIIITIMVLELHPPHEASFAALLPVLPSLLSYILSFVYLAIYWNNHHHMLKLVKTVNGAILWANMGLLFCLSLVPFATAWLGQHHEVPLPAALYGAALILPAIAWQFLQAAIIRHQGRDSVMAAAVGGDLKGKLSVGLYAAGIGLAWVNSWLSIALYAIVALMWLVPDQRFERHSTS